MAALAFLQYLFLPPGPPGPEFGRWGLALAGVYLAVTLSIAFFHLVGRTLIGRHRLKMAVLKRITGTGLGLQAIGLLFLACRALNLPVLSIRAFLAAQLAATAFAVVYLLWWLRRRYPPALAAYEWEEKKRAYLPRAAGGAGESARRQTPARHRR